MKEVILKRVYDTEEYTVGIMIYKDPICLTLELPWKDNQKNVSCIPKGEYNVSYYGGKYHIADVPDRTYIQIHTGNTVNDIKGCILLGSSFEYIKGKFGIMLSKVAFNKFKNIVGDTFKLKIV